ncbi:hypothetical protein AAVH_28739 [Aphelenchoides avenae]|nr:hypothetical protein AAVH_28739 [Aphelenchus avenae]
MEQHLAVVEVEKLTKLVTLNYVYLSGNPIQAEDWMATQDRDNFRRKVDLILQKGTQSDAPPCG